MSLHVLVRGAPPPPAILSLKSPIPNLENHSVYVTVGQLFP
jgi:hypothetical protein